MPCGTTLQTSVVSKANALRNNPANLVGPTPIPCRNNPANLGGLNANPLRSGGQPGLGNLPAGPANRGLGGGGNDFGRAANLNRPQALNQGSGSLGGIPTYRGGGGLSQPNNLGGLGAAPRQFSGGGAGGRNFAAPAPNLGAMGAHGTSREAAAARARATSAEVNSEALGGRWRRSADSAAPKWAVASVAVAVVAPVDLVVLKWAAASAAAGWAAAVAEAVSAAADWDVVEEASAAAGWDVAEAEAVEGVVTAESSAVHSLRRSPRGVAPERSLTHSQRSGVDSVILNHINLAVSDVQAARDFLIKYFGRQPRRDAGKPQDRLPPRRKTAWC